MVRKAVEAGRPYATAFVDVRMPPGWDGIETVARMWEVQPDLQIVICTAYSDYSWEDMMRRFGRSDNLLILKKPFDNVEVLQLAHALTKKWQVTEQAALRMEEMDVMVRQRTQELQTAHDRLRSSEERFSKAFHASPIPMAIHSLDEGRFADANEAFQRMSGFKPRGIDRRTAEELNFCADLQARAWPLLRAQKNAAEYRVPGDIAQRRGAAGAGLDGTFQPRRGAARADDRRRPDGQAEAGVRAAPGAKDGGGGATGGGRGP